MKRITSPIKFFFIIIFLLAISLTSQQDSGNFNPLDSKEKGLRGFVCDRDEKPLPNARLLVNMRKFPIKDDGTFFLPHKDLERDSMPLFLLVNGETDGKKVASARWVDYATGRENITIRLFQNAEIFGRIMTPEDKPVAGAKVSTLINVGAMTCHGTFMIGVSAATDETGQFALSGLYPDSLYKLRIECPGKERKTSDWIPVGTRELIPNLKIFLRDAPGFISGSTVDEKGNPLVKEHVILGHPCIPDANSFTDSQGRFRINDLVPGEEVTIFVRGDSRRVKVGEENIVFKVHNKKQ